MRALLTFENFVGFGGTETYTLTVANELERLGHDVLIYSPNRGAMAEHARQRGVRVVGADELPNERELVISCDAATCHELAHRYPDATRIFVAHSADFMLQAPPQLGDRCHAVVALNDRVARAIEARAWHAPLIRLRQPIDLFRFRATGAARSPARTVLVISNYLKDARAAMVEAACRANGLELSWIGLTTTPSAAPELALASADIVIGLGRSVLEAMAAGRAAYVYGTSGGDGWVTPERYPAMEADGFAGTSASEVVVDADRLTKDLGASNELMGEVNRDLASAHHSSRKHATELVELARTLDPTPPAEPSPNDELAHLVRLEFQNLNRIWSALAEASVLRAQLAAAQESSRTAEEAARTAYELLEQLRRTRRYRLACRIAAPLDRLRRR